MIGIFDSGIGGLSVWRHIRDRFPGEPILYIADQAHVPYGPKSAIDIIGYSCDMTEFLLDRGASTIVVACNTATAAAINQLRDRYPQVPFVGMEPAIKPAVQQTRSGVVGVLATAGTFESQRYTTLAERYAQDVVLLQDPCVGLVERIEAGWTDSAETRQLLEAAIAPMREGGIDTLILGCTHYPFVQPLIQEIAGDSVTLIDPAPAVARQVARVHEPELFNFVSLGRVDQFLTSGELDRFQARLCQLLGEDVAHSAEFHKIYVSEAPQF